MSYKPQIKCRACGGTDLEQVFKFHQPMPLANDFRAPGESREGYYPIEILMCQTCALAQLSAVVDPEVLYRHYTYVTSTSETMRRHFERLFMDLESEVTGRTLLELGSNDGTLLAYATSRGFNAVGVEPARNLAATANQSGRVTLCDFFNRGTAEAVQLIFERPSVILARHSWAHMSDWRGFMRGIELLSDKNTVVAIEVPTVHAMLQKCEFDQAYAEHLSYVSLTAVSYLLKDFPFHIHRLCHYGIHGGSLLIMLRHNDSPVRPHLSADEHLAEDRVTLDQWKEFSKIAYQKINLLRDAVSRFNAEGKRVCGFGASAKMTVWLNAANLTHREILFVTDNSPLKPGSMIPGTEIPVIDQELLLSEHPDVAFVGAWNYKAEILETQKKWRERGGKFIFPTANGIEIV